MHAVMLYRLSGLAVLIGMTIEGIASVLYSRAGGVALYLEPLVPADDLAELRLAHGSPCDKTASSTVCAARLAGSASATRGYVARPPRP